MTFAHVMGLPVEESALALAPVGAAILSGAALVARSKLADILRLARRAAPTRLMPGRAKDGWPGRRR
jgi:hypothetical protein